MKFSIQGVINQALALEMAPGEQVWAQRRSLVSWTSGIGWTVRIPGGIPGMVMRALSGESFFLLRAKAREAGILHLAASTPSVIYAWDLAQGPVTTMRGNFLAAVGDVEIQVGIATRPLSALFGGMGILLQTVYGTGTVFITPSGDLTELRLGEREGLRVATGNLAAYSRTLDYDVRWVGGIGKILLGGEGAIMTRIGGPGFALLQSVKRKGKPFAKILKVLELFV
jgi:uncharacterized protein (TIGR00266 family)